MYQQSDQLFEKPSLNIDYEQSHRVNIDEKVGADACRYFGHAKWRHRLLACRHERAAGTKKRRHAGGTFIDAMTSFMLC